MRNKITAILEVYFQLLLVGSFILRRFSVTSLYIADDMVISEL
jgi:hypothetical protein